MRIPDLAVTGGHVELRGFRTPPGIVLDRLTLDVGELVVEGSEVFLREPGRFRAEILEAELSRFIDAERPGGLRNIQMKAVGGLLEMRAVKTVLLEVKIMARVRPEIVGGDRLEIRFVSAEAMGVGVGNLVEAQVEKANPVLKASHLPVPAVFENLICDEGRLVLEGTFTVPA